MFIQPNGKFHNGRLHILKIQNNKGSEEIGETNQNNAWAPFSSLSSETFFTSFHFSYNMKLHERELPTRR